ncbi:hypothetical protein OIU85_024720 [Salix viminalis]|uniref:C2 domain-containing protein n=1 Tax=Salix viminalis TaxID=40686 RepID=A0A9Q0U1G3_SALVM|nr:hypothetical protein OIU85_024720 [Salix viminalis]
MAMATSLHLNHTFYHRFTPTSHQNRNLNFYWRFPSSLSGKARFLTLKKKYYRGTGHGVFSSSIIKANNTNNTEIDEVSVQEEKENEMERPPFDINLAVVLAGFAFEAYTSVPENVGKREVDAADCKTVYLSESLVREIYDGQLFIKLKKGFDLPAMDPWGTSDPYVVMELDGQVVKSKVKWGTKKPTWNEDYTVNIKLPPTKNLQVAAWDANLVTPHKRMGNTSVSLESLCDGNLHEVVVELEGMGGGGKLQLEVKYKTFDEIDGEKRSWRLPFVSDFLRKNGFESALKMVVGSETMPARQFVEYAFGQLKSFNAPIVWTDQVSNSKNLGEANSNQMVVLDMPLPSETENATEVPVVDTNRDGDSNLVLSQADNDLLSNWGATEAGEATQSDKQFWKSFADVISQTVAQKLGFSVSLELKWDEFDLLSRIGLQSQKIAEAGYVESGLATPEGQKVDSDKASAPLTISKIQSSLPEIKKVTQDLLRQTDSVLGAWMVLTTAVSKLNKEENVSGKSSSDSEKLISSSNGTALEDKKSEEMKVLFSTAESAMEAWAMLATSLGHSSFIKSEFEKICFLDNASTDTQVAIWRDNARKRLVVAFRGTEQVRWKDLRTDLMVVPTGLNPERIGGDFKQEVQVHSGFISAYDSVRIRIISIIKLLISYIDNGAEPPFKWHVYVTGHSLGGALATLLALELSSSQLVKRGAISVTMYNFGSPRVGNKKFAEAYNQKVKDSWRVVNHRDIVPTVPRLMGYCHVAQPVYLATGELEDALVNLELLKDGYQGDFIGESTPDVVVSEFMKGEMELIEKILQTEINIFRSIRDGSGLMQHMEDFYYITLLENVRSKYQPLERVENSGRDSISTSPAKEAGTSER